MPYHVTVNNNQITYTTTAQVDAALVVSNLAGASFTVNGMSYADWSAQQYADQYYRCSECGQNHHRSEWECQGY